MNGLKNQLNDTEKSKKSLKDQMDYLLVGFFSGLKSLLSIKRRIIAANITGLVIIAVYIFLIRTNNYESTITILPEYGSKTTTLSQLSSLASLAGIKVGESSPIQIYSNILLSEDVISNVVYSKYKSSEFSDSVNLIEYFEIEEPDGVSESEKDRIQFYAAYQKIVNGILSLSYSTDTGILTYTVSLPEAGLSADVANKISLALDQYIRVQRKSYAKEQRIYLERRIKQVKDSLDSAEESLKNFREKNRTVNQSPQLLLEQSRMVRNTEILQSIYVELIKQFELAKTEEVKDTPVLNIRENARPPVEYAGPKKPILFVLFIFIFFILSLPAFYYYPIILNYVRTLRKSIVN